MPCRAIAEVQRQERLHVEMRLAAADVGDGSGLSAAEVRRRAPYRLLKARSGQARLSRRKDRVAHRPSIALSRWTCVGQLRDRERVCLLAAPFTEVWPLPTWIGVRPRRSGSAKFDRPSPPKVVPEQREQRLVLIDRQQLPVAQRPSLRRETEAT